MNHIKKHNFGVDVPISRLQKLIYNSLNFENFEGYGRCFIVNRKTSNQDRILPTWYIGNRDYKELLLDDRTSGNFFFNVKEAEEANGKILEANVDIIFQFNLEKLTQHQRGDEEIKMKILKVISRYRSFRLSGIVKGINALNDFNHNLKDMQPYHFLKFEGKIIYNYC